MPAKKTVLPRKEFNHAFHRVKLASCAAASKAFVTKWIKPQFNGFLLFRLFNTFTPLWKSASQSSVTSLHVILNSAFISKACTHRHMGKSTWKALVLVPLQTCVWPSEMQRAWSVHPDMEATGLPELLIKLSTDTSHSGCPSQTIADKQRNWKSSQEDTEQQQPLYSWGELTQSSLQPSLSSK